MTATDFDQTMREHLERKPFRPFEVVLITGEHLTVPERRSVAYRAGTALYFGPDEELRIFSHEGVTGVLDCRDATPAE